MKKIAIFSIAVLFAAVISCKKQSAEMPRNGIINFMNGEVSLITQGGKTPAKVGDTVVEGMKIETGVNSFVDIYFGENAIKVLEKSIVEISVLTMNLKQNSEKTELMVQNGKVMSRITKKLAKNDSYMIKTPTTIAAVRGTEFLMEEIDGMGTVSCVEGKVAVKGSKDADDKFIEITEGQMAQVEQGKAPMVRSLADENKKNIQNILKDIREMKADIRKKFEDDREKIRQDVRDEKSKNKQMVEDQKAMDKKNIEDIKNDVKGEIDTLKGSAADEKEKSKEAINAQKDDFKGAKDSVKQDVQKFDSGVKGDDPSSAKPKVEKFNIK